MVNKKQVICAPLILKQVPVITGMKEFEKTQNINKLRSKIKNNGKQGDIGKQKSLFLVKGKRTKRRIKRKEKQMKKERKCVIYMHQLPMMNVTIT